MVHKNNCRNIQSIQQARMNHAYCVGLNPVWKKMQFQLSLNKTFCLNPQPLIHRRLKQRQRTKINKTMLSAPSRCPLRFSTQSSQYQNWEANKYSILTVNELGPPLLESSAKISKFYAPTDSEHKLNKTEIENWLPIGYNLWSSWLGTRSHNCYICSSANGKSLQVLYTHPLSLVITLKIFHFPETVQVFSNSTPITQSSINP